MPSHPEKSFQECIVSHALAPAAVGYRSAPWLADLPLMLVTPALFAANMVAARWAESAAIPPLFLACGRWSLAFLLLLPLVAGRLRRAAPVLLAHRWRLLLLAGLGMALTVAPQYVGARQTSAANVALIFAVSPVLVALLDTLVWREPLGALRAWGMLLALAGILVVLGRGESWLPGHLAFGTGDLWVLLAAASWAGYTVLGRHRPLPALPGDVRLAALIGGGALLLAPAALLEGLAGHTPDFADGRLYLALGFLAVVPSLGAYLCYDRLVARSGAAGASLAMYLVPLYAALAAWPLLGEVPRAYHGVGLALILGGVILAGRQQVAPGQATIA
jgi:drug/metabolite transporter (DMT)-like permease